MYVDQFQNAAKVHSFKEHSYVILISIKTLADFVLMSTDVLLKMVIVLSEMRIA